MRQETRMLKDRAFLKKREMPEGVTHAEAQFHGTRGCEE